MFCQARSWCPPLFEVALLADHCRPMSGVGLWTGDGSSMESRSAPRARADRAEVVVSGPDGTPLAQVALRGSPVTVGRLPEANDISLQPDPELLVTRSGHCVLEREGARWFVVDGGSVNGTYVRRGGGLEPVAHRTLLHDG